MLMRFYILGSLQDGWAEILFEISTKMKMDKEEDDSSFKARDVALDDGKTHEEELEDDRPLFY